MAHEELNCPHCEYKTPKRYNLNRHIRLVHATECDDQRTVSTDSAGKFSLEAGKFSFEAGKFSLESGEFSLNTQDQNNVVDTQDCNGKTHQCSLCEKFYSSSKTLKEHSRICKGKVNPLQCPTCHRDFPTAKAKCNHKRHCKGPEEGCGSNTVNNNYTQCTINNTTNNTQNNNITINIANFNAEKTEHITQDFARACFDKGAYGISPMVDKIYFNSEHPENHNVKLASLNHSLVEVYKNDGWRMEGLLTTIDNMISNSTGTMMQKLNRPLNVDEDLEKWNAIQNMAPEHKRKIREHTKSKLVERRSLATTKVV